MPLVLTIRNFDRLENGSPKSLVLDRRGAMVGRDPTSDWCLPDPSLHISSRHVEIVFRDNSYVLNDISTNGTFLAGEVSRLAGPHTIQSGDVFAVGHFEIVAALDDQSDAAQSAASTGQASPAWRGWDSGAEPAAPPASFAQWDAPPPSSAISGSGPMSQRWAAPKADAAPSPPVHVGWGSAPAGAPPSSDGAASTWGAPAAPPVAPASGWSSPIPDGRAAPSPDDVWGKVAASNVVDWARGGFGSPAPSEPVLFGGISPPPAQSFAAPDAAPTPPPPGRSDALDSVSSPASGNSGGLAKLLQAIGITPNQVRQSETETLAEAGNLLRRIVSGLVVMLEARARAKSQMGAQGTSLEFDGNNPLKFARTPEQALVQLLNPAERGFMTSDQAVEDAFRDLQAHQMATLKAMQGALRSTLDRFSPNAIRARAKKQGVLAKILPNAQDAALWKTYEREFSGVAHGSDEAFMDMFAKEFRKAYEEQARQR